MMGALEEVEEIGSIATGKGQAKLIIACLIGAALIAFGAAGAWTVQGWRYQTQIAHLKQEHADEIALAWKAKDIADERARGAERKAQQDLAAAAAQYEEDRHHAKLDADRHIADLAAGNERLRVALGFAAAGGGSVPSVAAGPGPGDGQATASLARPVAARLARRYADYNELVDQLTLCQSTVETDRRMTEAVSAVTSLP